MIVIANERSFPCITAESQIFKSKTSDFACKTFQCVCAVFKFLGVTAKPLARTSSLNNKRVGTEFSTITGDREIIETQNWIGIEIKVNRTEENLSFFYINVFLLSFCSNEAMWASPPCSPAHTHFYCFSTPLQTGCYTVAKTLKLCSC